MTRGSILEYVKAVRLGIVAFLVSFILVYNPALILVGSPGEITLAAVTGIVGVGALSVGIEGYLFTRTNWAQRILALIAGFTLIVPGWATDPVGAVLLAAVVLWQWGSRRSRVLNAA